MVAEWVASSAQLTRAARSLLIASVVFVPLLLRSDWRTAAAYALPIALICMIGYLINDLHDVEKDRENHPERALPRGALPAAAAAALFFALLTICLLIIRLAMPPQSGFLYVVGLLAIINYNYVVSYLWPLKNVYVGAVATLPLLMIWRIASPSASLAVVAVALFLHVAGTEMLSDIKDHKGDGATPAKAIGLCAATRLAFAAKLGAGLALLFAITSIATASAALAIIALEAIYFRSWKAGVDRNLLIRLMPAQVVIGLCFLF